ncbi:hypothetical protein D3C85_1432820 [compost metagenome]
MYSLLLPEPASMKNVVFCVPRKITQSQGPRYGLEYGPRLIWFESSSFNLEVTDGITDKKTVEKIIRVGLAGVTNNGDGLYLKAGRSGGAS